MLPSFSFDTANGLCSTLIISFLSNGFRASTPPQSVLPIKSGVIVNTNQLTASSNLNFFLHSVKWW